MVLLCNSKEGASWRATGIDIDSGISIPGLELRISEFVQQTNIERLSEIAVNEGMEKLVYRCSMTLSRQM